MLKLQQTASLVDLMPSDQKSQALESLFGLITEKSPDGVPIAQDTCISTNQVLLDGPLTMGVK